MSATEASSASDAACLPFSITLAAVTRIACPSEYRLRAPPVPPPVGMVSVSPWRIRTFSPVHAKLVHGELYVSRLVPLARALGPHEYIHETIIGKPYLRPLAGRPAGGLKVVGHADAALHPARVAGGPALLEPGPVHLLQRRIQHLAEVAAVIGLVHRRHVRHRRGRHHVAAPQLHPVNPGLERRGVNQPLDDVVALGPPGAAVGVHRGRCW